jgi:hypothetical protein
MIGALRKARSQWAGQLYEKLMIPISASPDGAYECYAKAIELYVNTLKNASVWPSSIDFTDQSLMTICSRIIRLPKIKYETHKEPCTFCAHTRPYWMWRVKDVCRDLMKFYVSYMRSSHLCVECLKTGHLPEAKRTCKVRHVNIR